jgi:hypothetical protein
VRKSSRKASCSGGRLAAVSRRPPAARRRLKQLNRAICPLGAQRLDVIDGDAGAVFVAAPSLRKIRIGGCASLQLRGACAQEMRLAGAGLAPQQERGFAVVRSEPGGNPSRTATPASISAPATIWSSASSRLPERRCATAC